MSTFKAFGGKLVTRAPKGGFDHPVNGKHYRGGQFCPMYAICGGSDEVAARVLPVLSGSEKQVAWAEQVRAKAFDLFDRHRDDAAQYWSGRLGDAGAVLARVESNLVTQSTARFWIDNRYDFDGGHWIDSYVKREAAAEIKAAAALR